MSDFKRRLIEATLHQASGNRTIASLYDLYPRAKLMTNVGIGPKTDVWQHARIVSRKDGSVEHWLNGVKVLEFNRYSEAYRAKVGAVATLSSGFGIRGGRRSSISSDSPLAASSAA